MTKSKARWQSRDVAGNSDRITRHIRERDRLVTTLRAELPADAAIRAVLLQGSLGRGTADAWSDVDVTVFIDDDDIDRAVRDRLAFPHRVGEAVYVLDSMWNAPLAGAQVNALYRLASGLPVYVDWNLFPMSMACAPSDARVLYESQPGLLSRLAVGFDDWATYQRQPRPDPSKMTSEVVRHARFGMVPIAAKFSARGSRDRLLRLLAGIGAEMPQDDRAAELAVIRERLRALQPGESPMAIEAVANLIDAVERTQAADTR